MAADAAVLQGVNFYKFYCVTSTDTVVVAFCVSSPKNEFPNLYNPTNSAPSKIKMTIIAAMTLRRRVLSGGVSSNGSMQDNYCEINSLFVSMIAPFIAWYADESAVRARSRFSVKFFPLDSDSSRTAVSASSIAR